MRTLIMCRAPPHQPRARRSLALVLAASAVVHCTSSITVLAGSPDTSASAAAALPTNVRDMRDMILVAVRSGNIEDLAPAIEQNELPPEFGSDAPGGAIAQLKALSVDGSGRDLLAILADVLETEPAKLPIGRDHENNIVYVWPGLSEKPLDQLSAAEHVALLRLMSPTEAKAMIDLKNWTWWRLAIGADGTWLTFMKSNVKSKSSK